MPASILSTGPVGAVLETTKSEENDFIVTLDQTKRVELYGHSVTPLDAIVMRGIMPDNNVASLKLINCIGKQLAYLERQDADDAKKWNKVTPNVDEYYKSLPPRVALTRQVDKAVNAHTARLLQVLGTIDKARNKRLSYQAKIKLRGEIVQVFSASINHIKKLQKKNPSNKLVQARCNAMIAQLESQQKQLLENRLLNTDPRVRVPITTDEHQRLFRTVLQQYEGLEGTVSAWEGVVLNRSATEAYQDASMALQNHEYSVQMPDDMQLWHLPNAGEVTLDTAKYGGSFERDTLLFTLGVGEPEPLTVYEAEKRKILARQNSEVASEEFSDAKNPESEVNVIDKFRADLERSIKDFEDKNPGVAIDEKNLPSILNNMLRQSIGNFTLPGERPLHIHSASSLYGGLGYAAETMSSYFAQMGAKQPGKVFFFFGLTAMTMGAGALASTGHAAHLATQCLQMVSEVIHKASGGKISAATVQSTLLSIEQHWAQFTHSDSLMKRLIMDVIGLPKLTFMMGELLTSNRNDRTTLKKIAEQFKTDELLYQTEEQKMAKALVQAATTAIGLGMIAAGGILVNYLAALPASPLVHLPLEAAGFMAEVSPNDFTGIVGAHGILPEVVAIASAMFAVKASGLVAGKMYLVGKELIKENEDPAVVQRMEIISALYMLHQDDPVNGMQKIKIAMEKMPKVWDSFRQSVAILKNSRPELFAHMNTDPAFLEAFDSPLPLVGGGPGERALSDMDNAGISFDMTLPTQNSPGLFRRGITAAGSALWNGLIAPPLGFVYTGLYPIVRGIRGIYRASRSALGYKNPPFKDDFVSNHLLYQGAKFYRGLIVGPSVFLWNGLKMGGNSIYRTAFLAVKALVSAATFTAMCIVSKGGMKALLGTAASIFARGGLRLSSTLVSGAGGLCRGVAALALSGFGVMPIVSAIGMGVFSIGGLYRGIKSAIQAAKNNKSVGEAFKAGFLSRFNDGWGKSWKDTVVSAFIGIKDATAPISKPFTSASDFMDEKRQALHDWEERVETDLLDKNPNAETIRIARDQALAGINTFQSWVKNSFGRGINYLRTQLVRASEEVIQDYGSHEKDTVLRDTDDGRTSDVMMRELLGPSVKKKAEAPVPSSQQEQLPSATGAPKVVDEQEHRLEP